MEKEIWKPGNMVYPLPAVLVSVADKEGNYNVLTVAWVGTICTNPPMVSISVRPERYSYKSIVETGEFVINLTTESMAYVTDYCGVRSGRNEDKIKKLGLETAKASIVKAPLLVDSPVNIECKVVKKEELGSHHMFMADVVAVHASPEYMDDKGKFNLAMAKPIVYSHGEYYCLGKKLGTFGYSVAKKGKGKNAKKGNSKPYNKLKK